MDRNTINNKLVSFNDVYGDEVPEVPARANLKVVDRVVSHIETLILQDRQAEACEGVASLIRYFTEVSKRGETD